MKLLIKRESKETNSERKRSDSRAQVFSQSEAEVKGFPVILKIEFADKVMIDQLFSSEMELCPQNQISKKS